MLGTLAKVKNIPVPKEEIYSLNSLVKTKANRVKKEVNNLEGATYCI